MRKLIRSVFALSFIGIFFTITPPASQAIISEQPCNQFSWTGEDDTAHQMSLPYNLPLGDTTYSTTYVTTNGTLTFGIPDATFHTYPSTPSISLAGYDWVTFGQGTSLSYGVTSTGFCVEWKVRPFPQSSGDITTIKLTVDTSRLPTWSGIVETTGWLPADLRRGIRFQSGEEVVQISEAFTINGGLPVEMQTCWDGTIIPMSATCPPEPPPGQCWDGSTVPYNGTCPPVPPDTQCWDGTWVAWSQTCPQMPPPIECWDSSEVNWNEQCPPIPPNIICWDSSEVLWNELCPIEPTPTPSPEPTQTVEPTPTPEPSPEPSPSISPTPEPTLEPSPTPSPTPTPTVLPTPEPTVTPVVEPSPEPTPSQTSTPEPTPTPTPTQPIIEPVQDVIDNASADGIITDSEREIISDALVEEYADTSIPFDVFEESGLDYSDLPPEQPVTLENGVVITAEVADAIEIFESPSELLSTVFTDPGKALKAIANVGADLTPEVRKDAQAITVSAVIVAQVIAGTSALTLARNQ